MKEQWTVSEVDELGLFQSAVEEARSTARPKLVSVSFAAPMADPIDVFAGARDGDGMLWLLPHRGIALVGEGKAAEFRGRGPERFAEVTGQWRRLTEDATVVDEGFGDTSIIASLPGPGPVAMGGFAFAPGSAAGVWEGFGDGRLVLPRIIYGFADRKAWVTMNTVVTGTMRATDAVAALQGERRRWLTLRQSGGERGDEGRPSGSRNSVADAVDVLPKEHWLAAVERVATNIREGKLEKAVLARSVRRPLSDTFSLAGALRKLRLDYPETYVFAVKGQDGLFFGATPERIVHLSDDVARVACMAGSIGRGSTEAKDEQLGETLLADPKNLEEHRVVLRAILEGLEPVCDGLRSAAKPGLRKLANVQHLYTPVRARAKPGVDVLELVSRIHPTPAIGGHPTHTALELIAKEEQMDRGWYAGPVGWMNARGEGEFAVGLRSGLVRRDEARLFAGCGIMGDSDAESEYAESVLKLQPMLRALEAGEK